MSRQSSAIHVKGKDAKASSVQLNGCTVISTGRWVKTARLFDEDLIERARLPHPEELIRNLRESSLPADIFTFTQRLPDTTPRFPYPHHFDNWAVAHTNSFSSWWDALPQESRKNARQAEKRGIVVRRVTLDDTLVHGIKRIYDETPYRQGRAFWHYGKPFETVKKENSTYLDRSTFIGAFFQDQLIGFIKLFRVDEIATIIQILALAEHRDKKPMNALIKETMELCAQENLSMLLYGKYNYGNNNDSSLTEFKRRNGFVELSFPRYFVPLTAKGSATISSGLHLGWRNAIPQPIRSAFVRIRGTMLRTT